MAKWSIIGAVLCLGMLSSVVRGEEKFPEVRESGKNGVIWSSPAPNMDYLVDTKARLCYAKFANGATVIPCASLKTRPEWVAHIHW
jgi:hypothetical protein